MPDLTCGLVKAVREWFVRQEPRVTSAVVNQREDDSRTFSMETEPNNIWSGTGALLILGYYWSKSLLTQFRTR